MKLFISLLRVLSKKEYLTGKVSIGSTTFTPIYRTEGGVVAYIEKPDSSTGFLGGYRYVGIVMVTPKGDIYTK